MNIPATLFPAHSTDKFNNYCFPHSYKRTSDVYARSQVTVAQLKNTVQSSTRCKREGVFHHKRSRCKELKAMHYCWTDLWNIAGFDWNVEQDELKLNTCWSGESLSGWQPKGDASWISLSSSLQLDAKTSMPNRSLRLWKQQISMILQLNWMFLLNIARRKAIQGFWESLNYHPLSVYTNGTHQNKSRSTH